MNATPASAINACIPAPGMPRKRFADEGGATDDDVVTSVTDALAEPPFSVTPFGVTEHGQGAGASLQVNVTGPLKPPREATVS